MALQYDEETGLPRRLPDGNPMRRFTLAPCRFKEKLIAEKCPPDSPTMKKAGCPKGTPEASRELSLENRQAYQHYLQCKGACRFPDDPIVLRNAGVIRQVEEEHGQFVQRETTTELMSAMVKLAVRV